MFEKVNNRLKLMYETINTNRLTFVCDKLLSRSTSYANWVDKY